MFDLFLSYSHKDMNLAIRLENNLKKTGISVWRDIDQVEEKYTFKLRIREGLTESFGIISLITSSYASSKWATEELRTALMLYSRYSERFPALKKNIILAVAERSVLLPANCASLINVNNLVENEKYFLNLKEEMHRLNVSTLCNTSRAVGKIITTENAIIFPIYTDDLNSSDIYVKSVTNVWKKNVNSWVDNYGTTIPRLKSNRTPHLKSIWSWIPVLRRYGKSAFRTSIKYLDVAREKLRYTKSTYSPSVSVVMRKAAKHLWQNQDISLVYDPSLTSKEEVLEDYHSDTFIFEDFSPDKFISSTHVGNPTDVIIGVGQMNMEGIFELREIYKQMRIDNPKIHDLFDLSILAGLIIGYEKWYGTLNDFGDVENKILKPLANDEPFDIESMMS